MGTTGVTVCQFSDKKNKRVLVDGVLGIGWWCYVGGGGGAESFFSLS
jgi:hypothetical protein